MLERRGPASWTAEPLFASDARRQREARERRRLIGGSCWKSAAQLGLRCGKGEVRSDGDLVLGAEPGAVAALGHAHILRVLGRPDVARDVIEGLMLDRGPRARRFDAGGRARRLGSRQAPRQWRTQAARAIGATCGELATFTIDPAGARDFDDAISAEARADGRTRVWVHIADVAAHVSDGSLLDREARRRASSVYVPGAVEPMLPQALSGDACSLVPGRDRAAVTVELDLDGARVERVAFHRSVIRSDERLDYDRVDRIFAGSWTQPG